MSILYIHNFLEFNHYILEVTQKYPISCYLLVLFSLFCVL